MRRARALTSLPRMLAVLGVLSGSLPALAQSEAPVNHQPVVARVYILSGQSNMVGSGRAEELDASWRRQPIEGAFIVEGDAYQPLDPERLAIHKRRFGPELGFARTLIDNQSGKTPVCLIKFALSGQPLDAGWTKPTKDGGGWVGPEPGPNRTTFYPGTSPDDPNIGQHYKKLHGAVAKGIRVLEDHGYAPQVEGIVWMQGEADAKHEVSAGRYDRSLALLKKRLEEDFTDGRNVPFVFGQVLPHEPPLDRFTHRDLIRRRMAEADCRSGSERAIDNVWMVSTDGMELLDDTVHYSTKGLLDLGQAFGRTMLEAHAEAVERARPGPRR